MKTGSFIQYFFYIGINWNWRIAFHILIHEIRGERKYGIHTTGSDELKKTKAAGVDISHATVYMPASYLLMEEVFQHLPPTVRTHFLDIGCGKGRAMCVAAHHGFNKVTGVDFSKEFCKQANANLLLTTNTFPDLEYLVVNRDALQFEIPADVDCIFFFNPFDRQVMHSVAEKIALSYKKNPRNIHIIYLNPLYKDEFTDTGFTEVFYTIKMKYMEAVILSKTVSSSSPR